MHLSIITVSAVQDTVMIRDEQSSAEVNLVALSSYFFGTHHRPTSGYPWRFPPRLPSCPFVCPNNLLLIQTHPSQMFTRFYVTNFYLQESIFSNDFFVVWNQKRVERLQRFGWWPFGHIILFNSLFSPKVSFSNFETTSTTTHRFTSSIVISIEPLHLCNPSVIYLQCYKLFLDEASL